MLEAMQMSAPGKTTAKISRSNERPDAALGPFREGAAAVPTNQSGFRKRQGKPHAPSSLSPLAELKSRFTSSIAGRDLDPTTSPPSHLMIVMTTEAA